MKEKSITMRLLAWRNIKRLPSRTCGLIFMITLFSVTLFGGSVLVKNLSLGISKTASRLSADIVVVPPAQSQSLQDTFLRGKASHFYLKTELVEQMKNMPGVEAVSPQIFISTRNDENSIQLIGFEQESDFVVKPWLPKQFDAMLTGNQVIVGANVNANVGDELVYFNHPFTVVGKMDKTGIGFDTSVFMPIETAKDLIIDEKLILDDNGTEYTSAIFIKTIRYYHPYDVVLKIKGKLAATDELNYVIIKDMLRDVTSSVSSIATNVYIIAALLWVLSIAVLAYLFSSSAESRKQEIHILRMLGTSRRMIINLFLREHTLIALFGGIIGLFLVLFILFVCGEWVFTAMGMPYAMMSVMNISINAIVTLILALAIGPLSSIHCALKLTSYAAKKTVKEAK